MTKQEILDRIEQIEELAFMHKMKDRWSQADFDYDRKLFDEKCELKKQLAEMEASECEK